MYNILICDDEQDILNALKIYLASENYKIFEAKTGAEAIKISENNMLHLIIMDIMMPVQDGISATAQIRKVSNVPIILLTAKSEDTDKVLGLNIGADDYITKPFNPVEVLARVRSQLRRYTNLGGISTEFSSISIGGISINNDEKKVTVDGEEIFLTPIEYNILLLVMKSPNKVFSSKEIYQLVWSDTCIGNETTVAVHIRHLREKIEINPAEPRYLKVVWGQGYKFEGR